MSSKIRPQVWIEYEPEHWFRKGRDYKLEIGFGDEDLMCVQCFKSNERFYDKKDAERARNELEAVFREILNVPSKTLMEKDIKGRYPDN